MGQLPHMWGQSLYILGCLLAEVFAGPLQHLGSRWLQTLCSCLENADLIVCVTCVFFFMFAGFFSTRRDRSPQQEILYKLQARCCGPRSVIELLAREKCQSTKSLRCVFIGQRRMKTHTLCVVLMSVSFYIRIPFLKAGSNVFLFIRVCQSVF